MKKAIIFFLSIALTFNLYSQDDARKAEALFNQAKANIGQNNFDQAINDFTEASRIYKSLDLNKNYVISQISLLDLLINLGKINEASPIATNLESLAILEFGKQSALVAHLYTLLGRIKFISSDFDNSKIFFHKSLRITTILNGAESIKASMIMSDLALLYANTGALDSAIYYNKENIRIITNLQGINSPNLVYSMINLSNIFITTGQYDDAINMKMKIIDIVKTTKGLVSEEAGEAYSGIGSAYFAKGEYKLAKEYLLKSNDIFIQIFGDNSNKLATNYINLGNLYNYQQKYDYSLQYYFLATKILESNNQQNSLFPGLYNNIGLVCKNQGNIKNAKIYFEKAIDSKKQTGNLTDFQSGAIYTNLASVYSLTNNTNLAIENNLKAIGIFKNIYGEHSPNIIKPYINLATLYSNNSKLELAEKYLIKSINSNYRKTNYTSLDQKIELTDYYDGIRLLQSIKSIAVIYLKKYNTDSLSEDIFKAYKFITIGDELISELRKTYHTKEDKLRLNSEIAEVFEYAIDISFLIYTKNIFDDENFIDKINYFIERNKTSTLLQSIKHSKTQKIANVPDSLLIRENAIREKINIFNQKVSEATSNQEESFYREKLLVEQENFKNIIKYYKNNYPDYYKAKYNISPSKISDLQKMIDEETVIINYSVTDDRLFAFVITKNNREVFAAPFISSDITDINDMNTALLSYKAADIKKYTKLSYKLFQKLFFFVIPDNIKKMIIIPSDIIGTVPFGALQTSEYTGDFAKIDLSKLPYLIKNFAISYSYSTTLLYETMNIDYSNSNRDDIIAIAPVFRPDNPQTFNYNDIETIIGSETEIQNIIDFADKNNLTSVILSNKDANEYKLKKIVNSKSFKIVHIATHGFVNFENPELSALILSKDAVNIEDGILYSGEIYNLKLKSELINLSACETARGKFSKGEGVIGLSRAFIYSGAKNLIISLWKVSDVSTTKEMEFFYKHLFNEYPNLQGNIRFSKTLQQAKLDMINSKFSHPYFWSPFILIGM